ncbi:MAG: polysaccharide biosynthesis C-terminal domain-containing protein [bacterium]|nr:polysaccharide biosynthesis C-terminal domain-containing protein [bacterium]
MTFGVLKFYSISLVFYSVYAVFNKIFYSIKSANILLYITGGGVILKLLLNFVLVEYHQDGLALSTSISFIFFFSASYIFLNKRLKIKERTLFIRDFLFHIINCIICFLVVTIFSNLFFGNVLFNELFKIILFISLFIVNILIIKHKTLNITQRVFNRFSPLNYLKQGAEA